jgi:hypothetical protein
MQRIEVNVSTGERKVVDLTPEEIADAQERTAVENAKAPLRAIERIESENPITHRALRELILTIGELHPAGKETVFYKKVLETELAVREERKKL